MSNTTYHRVKWIVKRGGLGKTEIEQWTCRVGNKRLRLYSIELCNSARSNWSVVFKSSPTSENFAFELDGRQAINMQCEVFVRSDQTEEFWQSKPTHVEFNLWRWEMKKTDVAALLVQAPIVFDIVVNVKPKPLSEELRLHQGVVDKFYSGKPTVEHFMEGFEQSQRAEAKVKELLKAIHQNPRDGVPLLTTICAEQMLSDINVNNVLETFKLAHNAKEIEEKCVSIIMLYYNELKRSEAWKNLRPYMVAQIMDLLFEASYETHATVLDMNHMEDRLMELVDANSERIRRLFERRDDHEGNDDDDQDEG